MPEESLIARELAEMRAREASYHAELAEQRALSVRLGRAATAIRAVIRDASGLTPDQLLLRVARISSAALGAARASIWLYDADRTELVCRFTLDDGAEVPLDPPLRADSCPAYVEAVDRAAAVAVEDTGADPRTLALAPYLGQHGVGALLDVPLLVPGGVLGVVCHEHVGGPRAWREAEVEFGSQVGALVGVALEAERRLAAERGKQASEARSAERERRHQTLLEGMELLAVVLDADGTIEFVNDHFLRAFGFTSGEAIGARWFELVMLPEDREITRQRLARAVESGEIPTHTENTLRTRAGKERRIVWTNTGVHDADGALVGTSSLGLDITDRLALEAMQLQEQKVESLGRLAVTVAHDFNNLLTVVQGAVEELATAPPPAERERARSDAETAIIQAGELTSGLLAYGRPAGSVSAHQALDEIASSALPILERIARNGVRLEVALHAEGARVVIDASHLHQLLVNLVANAVDATRGHGRVVRLTTELVELDREEARARGLSVSGAYAVVTVADDGAGLSPEARARLFEPFFTTKELGHGTGLGLPICETIARRAGGGIAVESEPGRGATFRVYLRRAEA